jgi:hypothetical protein
MQRPSTREQEVALVGAAFPDEKAAMSAVHDLGKVGLDDGDIRTAVWSEGRYVLTTDAGSHIWRSIMRSAVAGALLGTAALTAMSFLIWPGSPLGLLIIIGASFGGTVGVILGGYHGLNRHRGELWHEDEWRDAAEVDGEVLVVSRPGIFADQLEPIVSRNGGRLIRKA